MAHGGYGKRRVAERRPMNRRFKGGLGIDKKKKKPKTVSIKNQIRSTERMLRKDLPLEIRGAQEKKLAELKKQQELRTRLAEERKIFLRDRKIKFFERRKIERRIRRLERLQRTAPDHISEGEIADQLFKLKEDLEYVRFFPKSEKYVSLFIGGDNAEIIDKRNKLRKQIKANLMAAAASGKDLEETGSEDDGLLDMSEDDFFLTGSSSDEADADDEWTDKSTREQASSASGKAASGMSSDEKNQRQVCARALMPPPRPSKNSYKSAGHAQSRFASSSSQAPYVERVEVSSSSNTTSTKSSGLSSRGWGSNNARTGHSSNLSSNSWGSNNARTGHSSNLSSNSDGHKPRRKRRPKRKKQL
ncbi:rRNA-processing protein EFG1 [Cinnamomum micranthum f. kanehirae]|uniref:rRNA-processing protein EFG1 n=1 Tax=Cinnamomum micranthum f. kanehirae TaxID=337451 RepID=A0A443PDM7_9MAGN|nr:rRNA-processing protein EFG1 [Cinnamomum micranthum f. kanehirae]